MNTRKYYKEENGKRVWFNGILKSNGMQVINPSEEQILSEGWTEYVPPVVPQPTEEELLVQARERKLSELHEYDKSEEVDNCIIVYQGQEFDFWKDKHERDALKSAVHDYISLGRTEYRLDLRELGVSLHISCEALLEMLAQLEIYATDCYNKTTDHEFAIKACTTIDDVDSYIFRGIGYPDKLTFNL